MRLAHTLAMAALALPAVEWKIAPGDIGNFLRGVHGGRLAVEPAESEIGEPVVWTLSIEHAADARVRATTPDLGREWILLDDQRVVRTDEPARPGTVTTRISWRTAALEPGEHAFPAIAIEIEEDGAKTALTTGAATPNAAGTEPPAKPAPPVAPEAVLRASAGSLIETATLVVRPTLAPDEDAPRPQRGFGALPPGAEGPRRWPWIACFAALLALFVVVRMQKRKKAVAVGVPTPLERLEELERRLAQEPEAARAIVFDTLRLLRDSVDAAIGETRASLTDADWVARSGADERVPLGIRSASARLLPSAERIKYALEVPTRFALEELLRDVRHALEALAEARSEPSATPVASEVGEAA